jgi:hypothetical protein
MPPLRSLFALGAAACLSCSGAEGDADSTLDAYFEAYCRLYVSPCSDAMNDSCSFSISFDSVSECETFLRFSVSSCDETLAADLEDHHETVDTCIDHLQSFDCATEDMCDAEGAWVAGGDACAQIDTLIATHCAADTGV